MDGMGRGRRVAPFQVADDHGERRAARRGDTEGAINPPLIAQSELAGADAPPACEVLRVS